MGGRQGSQRLLDRSSARRRQLDPHDLGLFPGRGRRVSTTSTLPSCKHSRGGDDRKAQPLKKLITMTVVFTLIIPAGLAEAHHTNQETRREFRGVLPDAYYRGLSQCETGGDWAHSTRSFTGGLGISRRTAHRWSGKRNLAKLTPRQQVEIADRIAFTSWINPEGEKVWRVGPWGWGCLKQSKYLQGFICRSKVPSVQRWKRNCHAQ